MTEHKQCLEYIDEIGMCNFLDDPDGCPYIDDWNSAFKYCEWYCESD